jgi:hypothetical protein
LVEVVGGGGGAEAQPLKDAHKIEITAMRIFCRML